ncbi:MAG TPA: hypothetical protein VIW80_08690 [Pyrinomonadaceae bacterium]
MGGTAALLSLELPGRSGMRGKAGADSDVGRKQGEIYGAKGRVSSVEGCGFGPKHCFASLRGHISTVKYYIYGLKCRFASCSDCIAGVRDYFAGVKFRIAGA